MKQKLLREIIERTFAKIACPVEGNGVYAEIKKAIIEAYSLGRFNDEEYEAPAAQLANTGDEPAR